MNIIIAKKCTHRVKKVINYLLVFQELLEDKSILKVGVAIYGDSHNLLVDYGVICRGFLDLRYLTRHLGLQPMGLAGLANTYLDLELDKNWRTRCSDWEADILLSLIHI